MLTDNLSKNDGYALVTVMLATAFIMLAVKVALSSSSIMGKSRKNAIARTANFEVDYAIQKRLQKSLRDYLTDNTSIGTINVTEGVSMEYSSSIDFGTVSTNFISKSKFNECPGSLSKTGKGMLFCLQFDLIGTSSDTNRASIRNADKAFLKVKVEPLTGDLNKFKSDISVVLKVDTELYWRYKKRSNKQKSIIKRSSNTFLMMPQLGL